MLAPNHIYVFKAAPAQRSSSQRVIDYDFVQRELAAAQVSVGPVLLYCLSSRCLPFVCPKCLFSFSPVFITTFLLHFHASRLFCLHCSSSFPPCPLPAIPPTRILLHRLFFRFFITIFLSRCFFAFQFSSHSTSCNSSFFINRFLTPYFYLSVQLSQLSYSSLI